MVPKLEQEMRQFGATLVRLFESVLLEHHFQGSPPEVVEGKRFWTWAREASWKRDVVEIVQPAAETNTRSFCEVIFRVRLKRRGARESIFAGANHRDIVRKSGSYYYPESIRYLLRRPRYKAVVEEVGKDLKGGLGWFADYETPELCLTKLRAGETSLGPIQVGKASGKAEEFLMTCIGA